MGLFDWLRPRPATIPAADWQRTLAAHACLAGLTVDEGERLKTLAERFLAEKEFSTVGGLELSNDICLSIAAQGCLPILELGLEAYGDWVGIVVYPDEFVVRREYVDEDGIAHAYADVLSGEAWEGGPLLLSWQDVQMAGDDYNVVIHELAHKLDMGNGAVDGIPALPPTLTVDHWESVFFSSWEDFCQRVDAGEATRIDPYAAEAAEEFFAVLSESFFGMPDVVTSEYPALYALLRDYYRQDPLLRVKKKPAQRAGRPVRRPFRPC